MILHPEVQQGFPDIFLQKKDYYFFLRARLSAACELFCVDKSMHLCIIVYISS